MADRAPVGPPRLVRMDTMSEPIEERPPSAETGTAKVVTTPVAMNVNNDFPGNYAFTRYGMTVEVLDGPYQAIWSKYVWQRGIWLPIRPFYDRRLRRAIAKAERIAKAYQSDGYPASGGAS